MVIAIDGPAGAGKSTVARGVAEALGFTYLDSGAMYRTVALAALRAGIDPDDSDSVTRLARGLRMAFGDGRVTLNGEDVAAAIRVPEVTVAASRVSVHEGVREEMVSRQRQLIEAGRYVAEGRDIGTVVSPDSPLKVYLDATPEERARRRAEQSGADAAEVLAAQIERDTRDQTRALGRLHQADDAELIDTTGLGVAEVVDRVVALARERGLDR
jgi:cytidylate kinase